MGQSPAASAAFPSSGFLDRLLGEHWQVSPLLAEAPGSDPFAALIRRNDVDELIGTLVTTEGGWLMLTRDGKPRSTSSMLSRDGFLDLAAVYQAYAAGYTLILTMLQKRFPPIGALCRRLEVALLERGVVLSRGIGANLYQTPAGSRGFSPHYDGHDVLVMQLEGTKDWRVYGALEPFPVTSQKAPLPEGTLPEPAIAACLRPGQVLYIPRGVYHEAATSSEPSMHLTLSIFPSTWIDLMTRLLPREEPMRKALPLLPPGDEKAADRLSRGFQEVVRGLLDRRDVAAEAHKIAEETYAGMDPLPDDGLRQLDLLDAIGPDTRIRRRRGAAARLRRDGERLSLHFPGSGFRGAATIEPAFRFLIDHERFRVADLPDLLPEEAKTTLVRELVREGLLRVDG